MTQPTAPADTVTRVGRYHLVERLAVGGMAEVFLAAQRGEHSLDRLVVIKRILPHLAENPEFVDAFAREAKIAARIAHPNVVQIHELGESGGLPFIAMEYVAGSTLKQLIVAARSSAVNLPVDTAVLLLIQSCAGSHAAHELADAHGKPYGLVHRDISPHNLMVDDQGHVKLLDFGIAKASEGMDNTRTGLLKGKISYMSPEQCRQEKLDRRSDVFALGVVGYELLTGAKPFFGSSELATMQAIVLGRFAPVRELRPDVPEGIASAVAKALAPERDDRWDTADDLRRALREAAREAGLPLDPDRAGLFVRTVLGDRHDARRRSVEEALERTLVSFSGVPPVQLRPDEREPTQDTGIRPEATRNSLDVTRTTSVPGVAAGGVLASLGALVGLAGVAVAIAVVVGVLLWVAPWKGDAAPPTPAPEFVPTGEPLTWLLAPTMDPTELRRDHEPIRRYLERALDRPVVLEVAASYEDASQRLTSGAQPFALLPHGTAMKAFADAPDAAVVAVKVVDGSASTDGYLVVRRDDPAMVVQDLVGRTICYSDTLSSTGYALPRAFLRRSGLDPDTDLAGRISGNHQLVLVDLLDRRCDVGGTYSGNFQTADQRGVATAQLRILAITGRSPHDAVMAAPGTDEALVAAVRDALIAFDPMRDAGSERVGDSELITGFVAPPDGYLDAP